MKKRSPSAGIKSEPSKHEPGQSAGLESTTPVYKTVTASTMKRCASIDDTGNANPKDVSKGEANGTKRRKTSLEVRSRKCKECTEAWRVSVNLVATEGLRIMSQGSEGAFALSFDPKTQSIKIVFKEQCLSAKYPLLELKPSDIRSVKRSLLKSKARLFTQVYQDKTHSFDVSFSSHEDCETFLKKIQLSCYHRISTRFGYRYEMCFDS